MNITDVKTRLARLSTKMWNDSQRWKNPDVTPKKLVEGEERHWIGTWERTANEKNWANYLMFWGLEEDEIEAEKGATQVVLRRQRCATRVYDDALSCCRGCRFMYSKVCLMITCRFVNSSTPIPSAGELIASSYRSGIVNASSRAF